MITEQFFTHIIDTVEAQMRYDVEQSDSLSSVLKIEEGAVPVYDNSRVIRLALDFLHLFFPKDENGFSCIEHYCFDLNFGKSLDGPVKTSKDLYHELVPCEEYMVLTHPLIDNDVVFTKNKP